MRFYLININSKNKDLMEEVESLRNEITDQNDTSSVMQEQFKKQHDEVYILKKKLEDESAFKENQVAELKAKFSKRSKSNFSKICTENELSRLSKVCSLSSVRFTCSRLHKYSIIF